MIIDNDDNNENNMKMLLIIVVHIIKNAVWKQRVTTSRKQQTHGISYYRCSQ